MQKPIAGSLAMLLLAGQIAGPAFADAQNQQKTATPIKHLIHDPGRTSPSITTSELIPTRRTPGTNPGLWQRLERHQ